MKSEKSKCFIVIEFLRVESYAKMLLILCKDKKIIWKTNEMRTKIFERKFPVGQFTASN